MATHKVSIKVEAPPDTSKPTSTYRTSVFSVDLESPLSVARIQKIANDMLVALTDEADVATDDKMSRTVQATGAK